MGNTRPSTTSSARMEFRVYGLETISGDVRVDLRRRNVGMSEKLLDNTQVHAPLEKMGRK